jgi:phospholipid/cholesterol/gamma-HCH transport system permease protein
MKVFFHIGRYAMMMKSVLTKPDKLSVFRKQLFFEIDNLGINSLGLVTIISLFMGMVITLQTASMIESAWVPSYTVGYTTRQSMILEFSPTIISLILAGKVGSNISSEIGTMRVTEQIDALEIMGVNSVNYLVLPKILGFILILPFIVVFSMFLGVFGGWLVCIGTGVMSSYDYVGGITYDFRSFAVVYALIKTVVFGFVITSIASYHGYYTSGGALEVGRSSTKGVVYSSIVILIFNVILTQLLLI